jgi:hypothetical protein
MKRPFREHDYRYWGGRRTYGPITEWDDGSKVWHRDNTFMVQDGGGWTFSDYNKAVSFNGPVEHSVERFNLYKDER